MKLKFNLHLREEFQLCLESLPPRDSLTLLGHLTWPTALAAWSHGPNTVNPLRHSPSDTSNILVTIFIVTKCSLAPLNCYTVFMFDLWNYADGLYMIEVDRILRPGGYWILSGPPINWKRNWKGWERTEADLQEEQSSIESVAKRLCWKKLKEKDDLAIWQKPTNHVHCQKSRKIFKTPTFCQDQDPDRAW